MKIAIMSEMDSRVILYPLIDALYPFGSICVFTSNAETAKFADRVDHSMRNIQFYGDPTADFESLLEMAENDVAYDFIIYDNIGATDQDVNIFGLGASQSPEFIADILYLVGEEGSYVFKMGAPSREKSPKKESSKSKGSSSSNAKEEDTDSEEYNKWKVSLTDEEVLEQKIKSKNIPWIPFPTLDEILGFERGRIFKANQNFCKCVYPIIKEVIGVEERDFMKGVKAYEGSINIDSVKLR